jgi:hypothetical protein
MSEKCPTNNQQCLGAINMGDGRLLCPRQNYQCQGILQKTWFEPKRKLEVKPTTLTFFEP